MHEEQQQQQQQQLPNVYVLAFVRNGLGEQQRLRVHELMEEQPNLSLRYVYNMSHDLRISRVVQEISTVGVLLQLNFNLFYKRLIATLLR